MTYQYQEVKKTEKKQEPDLFDYEQQHQKIAQGQQENIKKHKAEEAKEQQAKKHETGYEPTSSEETRIAHNKAMEKLYGVKSQEQKDFNKTLNKAEKITQKKSILIGMLWFVSVGLYFYNYSIGLAVLLFLSLLHVVMEFPLNIMTIKEIIKKTP